MRAGRDVPARMSFSSEVLLATTNLATSLAPLASIQFPMHPLLAFLHSACSSSLFVLIFHLLFFSFFLFFVGCGGFIPLKSSSLMTPGFVDMELKIPLRFSNDKLFSTQNKINKTSIKGAEVSYNVKRKGGKKV